ncbi:hypothetical protein [Castellaniella sp.]|uniref:hypothetical protein n=1 Tax=Castellaniella sp. TaxID=1955812 RepID=UPI002AFF157A|nr:hypothetical protein [Castellaniella sp.]
MIQIINIKNNSKLIALKLKDKINLIKVDLIIDLFLYFLFISFIMLCIFYQYNLLGYREWGDELETIVTVKMMNSGMRLYSEIFNHHGPLTFVLGLITELFGDFGIRGHRVSIAILQIIAILSIYFSPVLKITMHRIVASALSFSIILLYISDDFGYMYKYQTIAGIIMVIVLSQYTIPSLLKDVKIRKWNVIGGNVLISSIPFLSVTYLPISILFFLASFNRKNLKYIIFGSAIGIIFNIIFLGVYGSFFAFYAFHIYLNSKILPIYTGVQPGFSLVVNAIKGATSDLSHFLALTIIFIGTIILSNNEKKVPWRSIFIFSGICSLLMRGVGFHGMPYLYATIPFIMLILRKTPVFSVKSRQVVLVILIVCILKVSLIIPGEYQKMQSIKIPKESEFSKIVSSVTNKNDRIIVFSHRNIEYLLSKRLPASGNFFYLPWQEKYNETPSLGVKIDTCKQIDEYSPKIMYINKWKVWGKFEWDSYAECIQKILDKDYTQVSGKPYYLRNDVAKKFPEYFNK